MTNNAKEKCRVVPVWKRACNRFVLLALFALSFVKTYADGVGFPPATRPGQVNTGYGFRMYNQQLYVYVNAGERIVLDIERTFNTGGSNAQPLQVEIYSTTGLFTSYTIAASVAVNTTNHYLSPALPSTGIWNVKLTAGSNQLYWRYDLNAVPGSGSTYTDRIAGRVFTENLVLAQGITVDQFNLYHVNQLGHQYLSTWYQFNGIDSRIQTNIFGTVQSGCTPAYKSLDYGSGGPGNCGRNYKQFFSTPDATLPTTANRWDGTATASDWLLPVLTTPSVSIGTPTFTGNPTIALPAKGTFIIPITGFTELATLLVDVNNNNVYTDAVDRSIPFLAGNTVTFDGLDGLGAAIPCGSTFNAKVLINKGGEIHFLLDDVENLGGLTITRLNGAGAPNSTLYWDDTSLANRNAATDPTPAQRNGTAGVNSNVAGGVHGWTNPGNGLSWGNNRYIDNWATFPITNLEKTFSVSIPRCPVIAGNVWNDADGSLSQNGSETGTNAATTLYVNLVDATGTVIGSTTVATDGSYSLTAPANTTGLKLVLTGTASSTAPGGLPTGWVNTGEPTGVGNGATQTATLGQIELSTGTTDLTGQNFGIEQLPLPGSGTATVANAGGSSPVPVPPSAFTNTSPSTDSAPGSVTAIHLTSFPSNVTSLTINGNTYTAGSFPAGGVVVATTSTGAPTVPILVDPTNDSNPVSFSFTAIDNAGKESTTTGTAVINFDVGTTLSGTVLNDGNGLTDNTVNTSGVGALNPVNGTSLDGTPLYANLLNSSNQVIATVPVSASGTYSFSNVTIGTYSVLLSTNALGPYTPTLPQNWQYVGEHMGTGTGSDGTANGILTTIAVDGITPVTNANFGIDKIPTVVSNTDVPRVNPGGTIASPVSSTLFAGADAEDGTYSNNLAGRTVALYPTMNADIYYDGVLMSSGTTFTNFDPSKVSVDPYETGVVEVPFSYAVQDNAGVLSDPLTVIIPFTAPVVSLSGTVWNDADGSLTQNGSETGTNAGVPLYVNLVDAAGTVVASTTVAAVGTYSLTGVPANTTGLKLVLTNSASSTAPGGLPAGWVNTGENVGAGNTATQTATLGQIELSTGTTDLTGQNFGIEQLPLPGSGTATVANAGGSSPVPVPPSAFTNTSPSTDSAPGSVTAIHLTSFPSNVTSLTINGNTYTAGSFPVGGVVVATTSTGAPTVPILVDPTNDSNPVSFSFTAIDNAGKESLTTGTAVISFPLVPDLTPIIYARPSTVYQTTTMSVVVDVVELLGVPTSGLITVRVSKDAKMPLVFPPSASSLGGRSVQNSVWSFDGSTNPSYYILTSSSVVSAGDKLSFGFTGQLIPGATTGTLTGSAVIVGGSGGEVRIDNNVDADKVDYFQQ